MTRIGILGGTFDPPHRAHVAMATAALDRVPLDRVLVMPAPNPPHKKSAECTPYETRREMARIAFEGVAGVELSTIEETRRGPSYTVDMLELFVRDHDTDVHLILGADSLADLSSWKDPKRILEIATLIVFPRSGYSLVVPIDGPATTIVFEDPVIDVSSTQLRQAYRSGVVNDSGVPPAVHEFILDNSVYA
jgi:nicotinate-nucleotide adenylyltransferase